METNNKIKEVLLKGSYVSEDDIKKAELYAKQKNSSITEYLLIKELITKDLIGQAMAEFFGIPYSDLNTNIPSIEQIFKIPESVARKNRAVLFLESDKGIVIATDNPTNETLFGEMKTIFPGRQIMITYSLEEDIDKILTNYRKPLETRFSDIIKKEEGIAPKIIDEIIDDAVVLRASDVHFEPQKEHVLVRFRIDGVLYEAGKMPKLYYENVLNKIKVSGQMRIDEHFAAQDGSIRYKGEKQSVDMRVSIVPTAEGEKIVIRILAKYVQGLALSDLGLSEDNQKLLVEASKKPFGMMLITGPTGSGKTTSLYAILKILNNSKVNITTIEDPIEYHIDGINQIQVNNQTNLTFAQGLRSIVRQDPDIILVGEIRDDETTEIAVNAALTGHLLFSTFHSNDAATAIPRLLDMNIEPFLLASTLELIVAQRLVRKICDNCRYSFMSSQKQIFETTPYAAKYFPDEITLYRGKGCRSCNNSGYKGRTSVFEIIKVTKEMHELILQNPSTEQIWNLAQEQGSKSLFEDGIDKVKKGITTLEEVVRVARPN